MNARPRVRRTITMPVWQFVRLMVQVEATLNAHTDQALKKLYLRWEDLWVDLDAALIDAGKRSREDFADIMMMQDVYLEDLNETELGLIRRELRTAIKTLQKTASAARDKIDKRNINFEWREIELLLKELGQH